jgi:hypothetical protein
LHAQIQVLLDDGAVAHRHPGHGVAGVGRQGLQLRQDGVQIIGRVFTVYQQPVKTGTRANLGAIGVRHAQPQADLRLPVVNGLLEGVDRCFHGGSPCCLAGAARRI